jgi:hypothetical protein
MEEEEEEEEKEKEEAKEKPIILWAQWRGASALL